MTDAPDYYSTKQAAKKMKCNIRRVYYLVRKGVLRFRRRGKYGWMEIDPTSIDELMKFHYWK
jgi:hypothetical protein